MPGTPEPVLGSGGLTLAVACVAGAAAVAFPFTFGGRVSGAVALAVGGGLAYAVSCLAVWFSARFSTGGFARTEPGDWSGIVVRGVILLGAQAGVTYYSYARWELLAPLGALFVVTVLVILYSLSIGGETDSLVLYAYFFGPILVGGTSLVALAEFAVRLALRSA